MQSKYVSHHIRSEKADMATLNRHGKIVAIN